MRRETPGNTAAKTVYLGLGSNVRPEDNLRLGMDELEARYGELVLSPVYRSAAVGFEGDDFLNTVVGLSTADSARAIHEHIETVHDLAGRQRGSTKFAARTLDIDLLLYGDAVIDHPRFHVPRSDVLEYGFVLRPLADIAADVVHPETGRTIGEHWAGFDTGEFPLELVDFGR